MQNVVIPLLSDEHTSDVLKATVPYFGIIGIGIFMCMAFECCIIHV